VPHDMTKDIIAVLQAKDNGVTPAVDTLLNNLNALLQKKTSIPSPQKPLFKPGCPLTSSMPRGNPLPSLHQTSPASSQTGNEDFNFFDNNRQPITER